MKNNLLLNLLLFSHVSSKNKPSNYIASLLEFSTKLPDNPEISVCQQLCNYFLSKKNFKEKLRSGRASWTCWQTRSILSSFYLYFSETYSISCRNKALLTFRQDNPFSMWLSTRKTRCVCSIFISVTYTVIIPQSKLCGTEGRLRESGCLNWREGEREDSAHRPNPFSEINSSRNVSLSHGPTIYLLTQLSLPFSLSFYPSNELEWYGRGARVSSDRPVHCVRSSCSVKTHKPCVSSSTVTVSANTHTQTLHPLPAVTHVFVVLLPALSFSRPLALWVLFNLLRFQMSITGCCAINCHLLRLIALPNNAYLAPVIGAHFC